MIDDSANQKTAKAARQAKAVVLAIAGENPAAIARQTGISYQRAYEIANQLPDDQALIRMRNVILRQMLGDDQGKHRTANYAVLRRMCLAGHSDREIAEACGVAQQTASRERQRCIDLLRQLWESHQ